MKKRILFIICTIFIIIFVSYPYLIRSLLPIEQDTFFHLSRIEGYAKSLSLGRFIPNIYFDKNYGYGYASALFYCDLPLFLASLLYYIGIPLSISYKIFILLIQLLTWISCFYCIKYITRRIDVSICIAFIYLSHNYRINNLYVRGALGELLAMIFLPLLLLGMYQLFYENNQFHSRFYLTISLIGLILSHNLSFILGITLFMIFLFIDWLKYQKFHFNVIIFVFGITFLCTCFFTLPMLEQLHHQQLYVHYYGTQNNLAKQALTLNQFIQNDLRFGPGGFGLYPNDTMPLNTGYFLLLLPLFSIQKQMDSFTKKCILIGYFILFLPIKIIPWNYLGIFSILQFPWRLFLISSLLLIVPSAIALQKLHNQKIMYILFCFIMLDTAFKLKPVCNRTFGITSTSSYKNLLDGSLIDQGYSAFYSRVELAGGDYLPISSINFKKYPYTIKDYSGNFISNQFFRQDDIFYFYISAETDIELPITWYFGYQIKDKNGNLFHTFPTAKHLVGVHLKSGNYQLIYQPTTIQQITKLISLLGIFLFVLYYKKRLHQHL